MAVDYDKLVDASWKKHRYVQGTGLCVAFKHGAEWQDKQNIKDGEAIRLLKMAYHHIDYVPADPYYRDITSLLMKKIEAYLQDNK